MQNYSDDAQRQNGRSRKYDTYIPPTIPVEQSILYGKDSTSATSSKSDFGGVHQQKPVQQTYLPPSQVKPIDFTPPKSKLHKKLTRKLFAGSIMHATVQVDRVTRQSMKALRHSFEPPEAIRHHTKNQKLVWRSVYAVAALSVIFSVYSGLAAIFRPSSKVVVVNKVGTEVKGATTYASSASFIPSEEKTSVDDLRSFVTAPQYPRWVRIPSINVWAKIKKIGLDVSGQVAMPDNTNDIGWLDNSARPGDSGGATVLAGYVAGPYTKGVFWDLSTLKDGTAFEIEKGNGEIVRYKVSKIVTINPGKPDLSRYVQSEIPKKHDVKLVSIVGSFSKTNYLNSEQIVVYGVLQ